MRRRYTSLSRPVRGPGAPVPWWAMVLVFALVGAVATYLGR